MSHPMNKFRQNNVSRARVAALTGKASKVTGSGVSKLDLGGLGSGRAEGMAMDDEPLRRASGGRAKKSGTTIVNVITGGQQQPPAPPPMPPEPPMMPPPGPPPMAPPGPPMGGPPMGGPPGMKPPMPGMGPGMPMRARGGGVKAVSNTGTKVQHSPGKNDLKDMNRKRVVTFATGGGVVSFATGGAVAPATKLPGGAGGGLGRLAKARKY